MKYVASCSFGKDSLAMCLMLIEREYPLDIICFYDTGMEFDAIYNERDKFVPYFKEHGIEYVELKPARPFLYDMFFKPITDKELGITTYGYGWCGGYAGVLPVKRKQYQSLCEKLAKALHTLELPQMRIDQKTLPNFIRLICGELRKSKHWNIAMNTVQNGCKTA